MYPHDPIKNDTTDNGMPTTIVQKLMGHESNNIMLY